jgi:hypothetical protein
VRRPSDASTGTISGTASGAENGEMSNHRYKQLQQNVPMGLYDEIEKARAEAQAQSIQLGEESLDLFVQTLIRLGLADMDKFLDQGRLIVTP